MEMEEVFSLEFPVFGYDLMVYYTDDIKRSRDTNIHGLGMIDEILGPNVDGLHSYNKRFSLSHIFITPESSIGTIAHEVFHFIWQMMNYKGAELENEVVAYHLSYTLDEILKWKAEIDNKMNDEVDFVAEGWKFERSDKFSEWYTKGIYGLQFIKNGNGGIYITEQGETEKELIFKGCITNLKDFRYIIKILKIDEQTNN